MNNKLKDYQFAEKSYKIIGICMEIHKILGKGMLENVYKDAIEYEFKLNKIPFEREKKYIIPYKDIILAHYFYADFVVYDSIILEVKAQRSIINDHYRWVINYLAISKCPLGLLINFGDNSLIYKRVVLNSEL